MHFRVLYMFYYSNGLLVETHSLAHSVIYEELLMIVLSMMMKKYLLKKKPNSRLESYPIYTKLAKPNMLFMTEKTYSLRPYIPI